MKRFWGSQRGFIGPIGDDLPSLIPLTVALLVFFAAFGFAFTHFESEKQEFDQRLLLLSIGKTLKGDGLIDSFEKWKNRCNSLEVTRYKFRAVVFTVSTKPDAVFYNYEFFSDWQKPETAGLPTPARYTSTDNSRIFKMNDAGGATQKRLACDNFTPAVDLFAPASDLVEIFSSRALAQNTLRINFPVAVLEEDASTNRPAVIRPAILAVMVWKS